MSAEGQKRFYDVVVEHSVELTIPTGQFANVKPGYKVSAKLYDGVHPDEAKEVLTNMLDRWLQEYLKKQEEDG